MSWQQIILSIWAVSLRCNLGIFFFNKQKILNRVVASCDFKQFVKKSQHLTNAWIGISPWFWLRAQITLLNRISPGQVSGEFPHLYLLSLPDTLPSPAPHQSAPRPAQPHCCCCCAACLGCSDTQGAQPHWPVTVFSRSPSLTRHCLVSLLRNWIR